MKTARIPQVKFWHKVVDMHVLMKTAEIPQVCFTEKVVDIRVVMQRKVSTVLREQKTMKAAQVQFEDEAVDVRVMTQRQVWRGQQDTKALKVQFCGKGRNRSRTFPCRSFLKASSGKSKATNATCQKSSSSVGIYHGVE